MPEMQFMQNSGAFQYVPKDKESENLLRIAGLKATLQNNPIIKPLVSSTSKWLTKLEVCFDEIYPYSL